MPADNPISPGELPPELHVTVLDAAVRLRRYRAIATQSVALFGRCVCVPSHGLH